MGKATTRQVLRATLRATVLLLTGCSLSSTGLTLFPEGHRLLEAAKAVRNTSTEPLPLPRELDKRVLPPYTVEPGDVLLVAPADLDSPVRMPADQPVLPDGSINLGRYGRVLVAGRTVDDVEAVVREAVRAQEKNAGPITVRVVTRVSKVYYVLGEVNAPGAFTLNGRETVLDGILAAGGLNDRASRKEITLSRPSRPDGCRVVLPICYSEIVQLGDTSTNYQLAPGDRIFVPTREAHGGWWPFQKKKEPECPPCNGPQMPCPAPPACGGPATPAYGLPCQAEPAVPAAADSRSPVRETALPATMDPKPPALLPASIKLETPIENGRVSRGACPAEVHASQAPAAGPWHPAGVRSLESLTPDPHP